MGEMPTRCVECDAPFSERVSFVRFVTDPSQKLADPELVDDLPELTAVVCTRCETINAVNIPRPRGGETPPSSDRYRVDDDKKLR